MSSAPKFSAPLLDDIFDSFFDMFAPPFRAILVKTLGLTFAALAALWLILFRGAAWLVQAQAENFAGAPWLMTVIDWIAGLGFFVALIFLVAPASLIVAGFFLDDIADHVEARISPQGPRGRAAPTWTTLFLSARFALVSLAVNLFALLIFLLPGANALVFVGANAYLFSREYFELSALRFLPREKALDLRARNGLTIFAAGLPIAIFVALPGLNLLTPLFGVGLMARRFKRLYPSATRPG